MVRRIEFVSERKPEFCQIADAVLQLLEEAGGREKEKKTRRKGIKNQNKMNGSTLFRQVFDIVNV